MPRCIRSRRTGTIGAAAIDKHETAIGAHAIVADPSNRFAFVPHIARIQDNVLEPPKNMKLTRFRGARQAFNRGFSDVQDASALFT